MDENSWKVMNEKMKGALEKQLELLVKCAEENKDSASDLAVITEAMVLILRYYPVPMI